MSIPNGSMRTVSETTPTASDVSTRSGSRAAACSGSAERPNRWRFRPTTATTGMRNANWNFTSSAKTAPNGGRLRPAAAEGVDRGQQHERADRVDLAPHGRVEDRARVEQVDRGGCQPERLRRDVEPGSVDQLGAPAPGDDEQQPGDADVGQDARDLHEPGGGVPADDRGQRGARLAEQPQDVEVARRVVAEVARLVEVAGAEARHPLAPCGERGDVVREAAERQVAGRDEDAYGKATDEDEGEDRAGIELPDPVDDPRAPSADGVAGHQVRRPRGARRFVSHAKVAVSIPAVALGFRVVLMGPQQDPIGTVAYDACRTSPSSVRGPIARDRCRTPTPHVLLPRLQRGGERGGDDPARARRGRLPRGRLDRGPGRRRRLDRPHARDRRGGRARRSARHASSTRRTAGTAARCARASRMPAASSSASATATSSSTCARCRACSSGSTIRRGPSTRSSATGSSGATLRIGSSSPRRTTRSPRSSSGCGCATSTAR